MRDINFYNCSQIKKNYKIPSSTYIKSNMTSPFHHCDEDPRKRKKDVVLKHP